MRSDYNIQKLRVIGGQYATDISKLYTKEKLDEVLTYYIVHYLSTLVKGT